MEKFDLKTEMQVLKILGKLLTESRNNYTDAELQEIGHIALMDPANVCMIISKTDEAKQCLNRFTDKEDKRHKIPELEYISDMESKARYSMEYMRHIMVLIDKSNIQDSNVMLYVRNDYPITIENRHFKIILAPRIEN